VLLQSQDVFDELAEVNTETWQVSFLSKRQDPSLARKPVSGRYSIVDGEMCALYRLDNKLCLRVGEQTFEITDAVEARLNRQPDIHIFQLLSNGNLLLEFTYSAPTLDVPLTDDPTPFVEEEDFDFPLFVNNVLHDTGRRQRIYNQNS
jgi:hypothetical protein